MSLESYDIVGSYNNQRVKGIDSERSVNLFEYIDSRGKKDKSLIFTSGLEDSDVTFLNGMGVEQPGGFRASYQFGNFHYHVIGNGVFSVNSSGISSLLGTLATSTGYVGITSNQYQILFVDGVNGWVWDTNAITFVQITDVAFPVNPIDCCYLDGFGVVISGGTNQFSLSSINQMMIWGGGNTDVPYTGALATDLLTIPTGTANFATGTSFTVAGAGTQPVPLVAGPPQTYYAVKISPTTIKAALSYSDAIATIPVTIDLTADSIAPVTIRSTGQIQVGSVTSHPGTLVACRTLHRRIFFFCQNFTEVWENAGLGTNLPFRRNNALLMEYGCAAIGSAVTNFDKLFFLSRDSGGLGSVMEVIGTEAIPASTRALDFQLSQYDADQNIGVTDAVGLLIKDNGLIFYRLNFTLANHTFVYNVTLSNPMSDETKFWHEEELLNGDRHPAQTQVFFNGDNYYGDYREDVLYLVSPEFVTNDGETIKRMRIGRPICPPTYQRTRIDRFQIDLLQGTVDEQADLDNVFPILTENGLVIFTESGGDDYLMTEDSDQDDSDIAIPTENPYCFLSYSKDGGRTFGNRLIGPMGKIGERTFRTVWRKLGTVPRGQAFVPKIEFYGQLPFVIFGAAWSFEIMPE